jgi:ferric-dicitrate binding protein FerR (iron transport regulator)
MKFGSTRYPNRVTRLGIAIAFCALLVVPAPGVAGVQAQVLSVAGDVSIVHADTGAQESAAPDATLAEGDYIVTGDEAQISVKIDGQAIRLDARTQLRVVDLDGGSIELQVASGSVDVTAPAGGGATIDTPTATVRPVRAGTYRISVSDGGQTTVSAGSGSVTIDGPSGTQTVTPGATAVAAILGETSLT